MMHTPFLTVQLSEVVDIGTKKFSWSRFFEGNLDALVSMIKKPFLFVKRILGRGFVDTKTTRVVFKKSLIVRDGDLVWEEIADSQSSLVVLTTGKDEKSNFGSVLSVEN